MKLHNTSMTRTGNELNWVWLLVALAMFWIAASSRAVNAADVGDREPPAEVWLRWSPPESTETSWVRFKGTTKDWDRVIYEARNWMPSADDPIDPRLEKPKSRSKTSKRKRIRRKVVKRRVNIAQYKAAMAANIGINRLIKPGRPATSIAPFGLHHVGGNLGMGGGNLEGAGYSRRSAQEALAACSYSGYGYPILYQGVARGRDGYFAYKIYRR